jgi:ABC-type branched-subunit amino acid transport system ATPase component
VFDIISGFLPLEAGKVLVHGTDVTALGPDQRARAGLGRSFQDARLFPGLTVREAIAVGLDAHVELRDPVAIALGLSEAVASELATAARVEELLDLLRLDAYRDKFISELSTGTRRMVDLACILGHEPTVVLFDEPSSGIAQREAEHLGPLLQSVRDRTGAALVVIEHDMPLINSLSDRLLALDLGRLVADGAPAAVMRHPAVVASYLGGDPAAIARSGSTGARRPGRTPRRKAAR